MSLLFNALVATLEMMGIFFCAFFAVYLMAVLMSPIENSLSKMVWKHSSHKTDSAVAKPAFKEFSKKHR